MKFVREELTLVRCCYCGQAEDFDVWRLELTDHVSRVQSTTILLVDIECEETCSYPYDHVSVMLYISILSSPPYHAMTIIMISA